MSVGLVTTDDIIVVNPMMLMCTACPAPGCMIPVDSDDPDDQCMSAREVWEIANGHIRDVHRK